jgi:hypothetical protein
MQKTRLGIVLVAFVFCCGACKRTPSEADLIGTWRMKRDQVTLDLALREDHVATSSSQAEGADIPITDTLTGTWRLDRGDLMLALQPDNGPLRAPVLKLSGDTLVVKMADGVCTFARQKR